MRLFTIKDLDAVCKMMEKYKLDEVACEEFTVKKTIFKPLKQKKQKPVYDPPTQIEEVEKEVQQIDDEPWNQINDYQLNEFSVKGKI